MTGRQGERETGAPGGTEPTQSPNHPVTQGSPNRLRRSPNHPSPATGHLLALAGYLLATLIFTWPLAVNLTTAIPGDSFDGWQNYWNQWWLKIALVDRITWPLFTDLLYHPTGVGLYFHTLNPFNGLTTMPVQLAFGLIPAYNAVVFISWVLAGYGMFLLTRWVLQARGDTPNATSRFTIRNSQFLPPFLAGLVYTLSPFHMAHLLGHMQVMSLQWLPFYALCLLRSIQQSRQGRPWLRSALLAGLFLVFNGLCDWYFVLYLSLFTGLAVLWAAVEGMVRSWRCQRTGRGAVAFVAHTLWVSVGPALVAGVVFILLLSPWLAPMVQEAAQFRFMVRPPSDLYILSASAADFFIPNRLHTLFRPGSFEWIGNQIAPVSERTIAIGYVPLALALVAGFADRRRAFFWWTAALFFFVLALGPALHVGSIGWDQIPPAVLAGGEVQSWTPYALLNDLIPFMRISRSVSRFALMVQMSMAVLAGLGAAVLLARIRRRQGVRIGVDQATDPLGSRRTAFYLAVVVLLLALIVEYWVAPFPMSPPDTPAYYNQLAVDPDPRAVLNLPMNYDRPGYLLSQTVHGKPLTVAYISRDDPRTLTERTPVLQHFRHLGPDILAVDPAAVGLTVLDDLEVGTVVLDRYKMPGGLEREYTEALAGQIFAGETPLFVDDRVTVYKVPPVATRAAYPVLGPHNWGPLEDAEGQPPRRVLSGGPAAIDIRHAFPGAVLRIRYRTAGDAGAALLDAASGALLGRLDPSKTSRELVVALDPLFAGANTAQTAAVEVLLQPDLPGVVTIESIALE